MYIHTRLIADTYSRLALLVTLEGGPVTKFYAFSPVDFLFIHQFLSLSSAICM